MGKYTPNDLDPGAYKEGSLREQPDAKASGVGDVCCQDCGKPFDTDMLVPDDVWERIKPEGKPQGGGLLCPTCIMDRAAAICGWTVGFVYSERHGHEITAGKAATEAGVEEPAAVPLTLQPIHIRLLERGARSKYIGLSDDAGLRVGELVALGELNRAGLVEQSKRPFPPGPPSMLPSVITDAGRAALRELKGGA